MFKRIFGKLYVQVLIGVVAGGLLGYFSPALGTDLKPLGDGFIRLIKMVFAPVIFAMVVLGIAKMESMKELGRVGARALIYFEVMSTLALLLGLLVVNVAKPGVGMNIDAASLDTSSIASYTAAAAKSSHSFVDFVLHMVPVSVVDALSRNDILQILVLATLFGIALSHMGRRAKRGAGPRTHGACIEWRIDGGGNAGAVPAAGRRRAGTGTGAAGDGAESVGVIRARFLAAFAD